jgi:DNA invertase Pin-like site-specific DNA recombinase
MELVEALSNFEVQDRLGRLSEKLAQVAASGAKQRPSAFQPKRKAGAVADVIGEVLAASEEPMRMCEIHAAVEAVLAESVPRSTIKSCLANNCQGATRRFVRLERGRYRGTVAPL